MNPILARFQDQPALIEEGHSAWLEGCLSAVAARLGELEKADAAAADSFWFAEDDWRAYYRPYVVKNGILHVPVKGVLLNDFTYAYGNYATGYEYIYQAVKRGVEDSNVKGIALVVNSGGGMVSGNFDLVDRIFAFRGKKPIRGFAAEHAYSAAYNIISAADHVTVARTGGVGSIGVVVVALEYSKMLEASGITVNIIRSTPDKMEGNPYEKLSEGARERIQERVDEFHKQFVTSVARNRSLEFEAVDATKAHTFMAQQAIDNGLADEIGALDDAITAFEATFSEGDEQMAEITQADLDTAVAAAHTKGIAEGKAEGAKDGAAAALVRINAIIGSDAGKARPKAALGAALKTSMAADEATAYLADLPAEAAVTAGAPEGMLRLAMENGGAGISADADADEKDTEMSRAAKTLAMVKGK
ncbi:S49 family peptidase [Mesorhizobium sp. INR15]|uniref:S49 family peptidase n=1 Tax=Mesorhizobium sp. INR15 TaxID=2654248 RepID=UPI00189650C0|nr:S49 family peptidase [Mesorhizobium sp. INR15]QPC91441.1 S49 family peptidase [Mesorhizobium sp. INR15]